MWENLFWALVREGGRDNKDWLYFTTYLDRLIIIQPPLPDIKCQSLMAVRISSFRLECFNNRPVLPNLFQQLTWHIIQETHSIYCKMDFKGFGLHMQLKWYANHWILWCLINAMVIYRKIIHDLMTAGCVIFLHFKKSLQKIGFWSEWWCGEEHS